MTERVEYLRQKAASVKPYICGERGKIITDSFKKTIGEPQVIRRAIALKDILENISVIIDENELIVGNHSSRENAAPIFPEFSIDFLVDEIDEFEKRPYDKFYVEEDVKNIIKEISSFWKGNTHEDRVVKTTQRVLPESLLKAWEVDKFRLNDVLYNGVRKSAGDGHIIPDYFKIMKNGIGGVIKEAEAQLDRLDFQKDVESYEKKLFLDSIIICYKAVSNWILRFAEKAMEISQNAESKNKVKLEKISEVCKNMSFNSPKTFHEALQLTYFCHLMLHIESNGHSISLGRMDRYLYPFYLKDIENGNLSEQEVLELIECFYIKVSRFNKVRPWPETRLKSGAPMFMTVTLGGQDREGLECSNELTYLFLDALSDTRLPQPTPVLRVSDETPITLIEHAAKVLLKHGGGLPAFFSDKAIISALEKTGIPLEDAREYAISGCSEAVIPGKTFSFTGGDCYFNFLKIMEIILHNGVNPRTGVKLFETNDINEYKNIDDIIEEYKNQLSKYMSLIVRLTAITSKTDSELNPTPFTSGLLNYRIEMGKDMSFGGGENAKYSHTILQGHGTADVCNCLYSINQLIFKNNILSFEELVKILDENWSTEEGMKVLSKIKKLPKYGNDIDEVDRFAVIISDMFSEEAKKYKPWRGGVFGTSLQGLTANVPEGETVSATPDGRTDGEALSDNISPHAGTDINGPTSTLKSVSKIKHDNFIDGNILNLRFHPTALKNQFGEIDNLKNNRFANMIKSYLVDLKGNQVQFNILSAEDMKKAQNEPKKYGDLVVKVAGYSAYFNSLDKGLQNQIIERTEHYI